MSSERAKRRRALRKLKRQVATNEMVLFGWWPMQHRDRTNVVGVGNGEFMAVFYPHGSASQVRPGPCIEVMPYAETDGWQEAPSWQNITGSVFRALRSVLIQRKWVVRARGKEVTVRKRGVML